LVTGYRLSQIFKLAILDVICESCTASFASDVTNNAMKLHYAGKGIRIRIPFLGLLPMSL